MSSNKTRDFERDISRLGNIFEYSLCRKSYHECLEHLYTLESGSKDFARRAIISSKINLLQELKIRKHMPLNECHDEYLGDCPVHGEEHAQH